ncbi:hypothetical protein ACH5RR_029441 [Cinchona calisaya]|uniref:Gag-pol polyprotein n=1 Tax=Cinchona calisaya TaxID=153742 RepID=A0ABD2YVI6_9GENT
MKIFMKGLKDEIHVSLAINKLSTYAKTLNRALNVESKLSAGQPKNPEKRARLSDTQVDQGSSKQVKKGNYQQNRNDGHNKQQERGDQSNQCRKSHLDQNCPRKTGACFKLDNQGHHAIACLDQGQSTHCTKCGRPHTERDCPWHNRACFDYGQQGHVAASSPNKGKGHSQTTQVLENS